MIILEMNFVDQSYICNILTNNYFYNKNLKYYQNFAAYSEPNSQCS